MSLLSFQEVGKLDESCLKLAKISGVNFAGVINKNGRLIAGGFRTDSNSYKKEKLQMIFLELYLDYSMRKEFDSVLGKINYMTTLREHVNVTTIPYNEELILILSQPNTDINNLVEKCTDIFKGLSKAESLIDN
ncbi:MAG: DUF6659 family protein [Candidatus Nitrosomaritimum yanchengensis]